MAHTYTAKGNGKRYRYYVCHTAQQRGWAACPTKSLNAHEIETAVVGHIRGMGENAELVSATIDKAREESTKRLEALETEQRGHMRELKRLHSRVRKLVGETGINESSGATTDRLADLQDQMRVTELRMATIHEKVITIKSNAIEPDDLARALAAFDPVMVSACRVPEMRPEGSALGVQGIGL
jgi:site-specific DNA recombinase